MDSLSLSLSSLAFFFYLLHRREARKQTVEMLSFQIFWVRIQNSTQSFQSPAIMFDEKKGKGLIMLKNLQFGADFTKSLSHFILSILQACTFFFLQVYDTSNGHDFRKG